MRLIVVLLIVWFAIGAAAAAQRDYFKGDDVNCAEASTIAVTIAAGPLNYLGVNPKTDCPDVEVDVDVPQPSQ